MANENMLNIDEITKRPINECLNWLSLTAEVNMEKDRMNKYRGN